MSIFIMDELLRNTISTYNSTAGDYAEKTDKLLPKERLNEFINYIGKSSGQVIDLGCGPGRDAKYLDSKGFQVIGVDLSSELLSIAKKRVPSGVFLNLDISGPFSPDWIGKCEGVWASASLVHVPQERLSYLVSQVRDVLVNRGVFYAKVMEGDGSEIRVSKRYGPTSEKGEKFWQYFSEDTFTKTLLSNGFDVLNIYRQENEFSSDHPWMEFFARKR